jgi:hypothetical protein
MLLHCNHLFELRKKNNYRNNNNIIEEILLGLSKVTINAAGSEAFFTLAVPRILV